MRRMLHARCSSAFKYFGDGTVGSADNLTLRFPRTWIRDYLQIM